MRKILSLIAICVFATACTNSQFVGMPNPWSDCNDDYNCASKIAGFNFPLSLSNYTVRAMKGMIEITYPLDEFRNVTVRKSLEETKELDNSGDYNHYEKNEILTLDNGVPVHVRKNGDKIYIMYFAAESGVFSARCEQGMTEKEANGVFSVISEAESAKLIP